MAVTLAPPPAAYVSAADITPPDAEVPSPPSSRAYIALRSNLPSDRLRGWIVTLSITAIAAMTRLWALGWPRTKVFDEVYYATEAKEVLRYGYEDNRGYLFIVHPPLGKWLIAAGIWLSEQLPFTNEAARQSFGWRIAPAIAGILTVLITIRVARRMFGSTLLGGIAGLLLSLDGLSLVQSRVSLLDIFLPLFLVSAFAALVVDRDQMRGRLLGLIEAGVDFSSTAVPRLGPRPMRLLAGVMLGLSFGIKWSAAPFMVGFLLLSFWWDRGAFKAAGVRRHWTVSITRSWITGLGSLVVVPIFAYLLTWAGWFAGENSFNRRWGETHSGIGYDRWYLPGFIVDHFPAAIRSLINYHLGAMSFHEGLTSPHPYESQPWSWLILGRPVSYYYPSNPTGCGSDKCTRAILMIGTPAIWWAFVPVLLWLLWVLFTRRDWRAGAIWIAFLAGWGFWLNYPTRTKFLFYMAPLVPFLIMGVAMALGAMLKWDQVRTDRAEDRLALFEAELAERDLRDAELEARAEEENADSTTESRPDAAVAVDLEPVELPALPIRWGMLITAGYLGLVVANFVWMWPIFTGNLLTYQGWLSRMWFDAWI